VRKSLLNQPLLSRCHSRIIQRANDTRNVARGGRLAPALTKRPTGFSFEVDDDGVMVGNQYLAQVKISVVTGFAARHAGPSQRPAKGGQTIPASEHACQKFLVEVRNPLFKHAEHAVSAR
jgi:hypothetical protein